MTDNKNKLFIFAGKPGVGKTTIIKKIFSKNIHVDILSFIDNFKVNDKVPEEKTIIAYKNMYKHLTELEEPKVVLEIGTNHPELNISEIKKLKDKYEIQIFLCDAFKKKCFERTIERNREIDKEALKIRLERDFPNTFAKLLRKTSLSYNIVDMNKSLKDTVLSFNELIYK